MKQNFSVNLTKTKNKPSIEIGQENCIFLNQFNSYLHWGAIKDFFVQFRKQTKLQSPKKEIKFVDNISSRFEQSFQFCIKYSTNKYQYQYQWSKYQYLTFKYQYQYKYCA